MLDVDLDEVSRVLTVSEKKLASKGTKSVRSRVTNLKPYLAKEYQDITTEAFRDKLLLHLFSADTMEAIQTHEYKLTQADEQAIDQLVADIYANDAWIFGEEPKYTIKREEKFKGGLIEANISVEKDRITAITIYGDYFSQKDTQEVADLLIGCKYAPEAIKQVLAPIRIDDYFANVTKEEFVQLMVD